MSLLLRRIDATANRLLGIEPQARNLLLECKAEIEALREELAQYRIEEAELEAHSRRAM